MGSLLDGIDVKPADTKPAKGGAAGTGTETSKTLKLAIAIGCFLVGGGLIAWNLGLFQFGEAAPNAPQNASATTASTNGNAPAQRPTQQGAAAVTNNQSGEAPAASIKSGPQLFTK